VKGLKSGLGERDCWRAD